jgi:hypothetical protein
MFAKKTEILGGLLNLDTEIRRRVIVASAVYPRTENLGDDAIVTDEYDGTPYDMTSAVERLSNGLHLKALGVQQSIISLLREMVEGTTFLDLGLDTVDSIVIQRVGRHIVCLKRKTPAEGKPGEPASGRSLFIELNDVCKNTMSFFRDVRREAADHTLAFIGAGLFVGLSWAATMAYVIIRSRSRK